MTFIESHQSLAAHPKTKRAARRLGIGLPQMVGHLHFLWWWAMEYAQDGSLAGFDDADIADAAGWTGDVEAFSPALAAAGFLDPQEDGSLAIHDWMEYAGDLIRRRKSDAQRKRAYRLGLDTSRMSGGHPADGARTVPNPTVPNPTVPNPTVPIAPSGHERAGAGAPAPKPPAKAKAVEKKPQATEEGYEFVATFCGETGDAFTGDRRRQEALAADELLRKAGSADEALAYVRWRVGSGQSPSLQFSSRDYTPAWRSRARGRDSPAVSAAQAFAAIASGGGT